MICWSCDHKQVHSGSGQLTPDLTPQSDPKLVQLSWSLVQSFTVRLINNWEIRRRKQLDSIFLPPRRLYWIKHQLNMVNIQRDIWLNQNSRKSSSNTKHTPPNLHHPSGRCRGERGGPEVFTVLELTDFCSWTVSWRSTPTTERKTLSVSETLELNSGIKLTFLQWHHLHPSS